MTTEQRLAMLLSKANDLPLSSGVYIMKDKNDKIIYVGKSKKLKNRVTSYFRSGPKNLKTQRMVMSVYAIWEICRPTVLKVRVGSVGLSSRISP